MEQLRLKGLHGACTNSISWTISGPGQPLHVLGKGYPQMAATAPMGQEKHIEKTPKTPKARTILIDIKNATFLLVVQGKILTPQFWVVSSGEFWF